MRTKTEVINKWWDSLTHEQKESLIKSANFFHWGRIQKVYSIRKQQLRDLYDQVHKLNLYSDKANLDHWVDYEFPSSIIEYLQ